MADLAQSGNTNAMFTGINASGNAVFMAGEQALPYQVSSNGATLISTLERYRTYGSTTLKDHLQSVMTNHNGHVFGSDHAMTNARSIEYGAFVNNALENSTIATTFEEGNRLAGQLSVVARMIAARSGLGVTRQVFMVSAGGFDHHDGLIGSHEALLGQVDSALDSFYRSMVELGVADQVTTFTASDFGRTLASNGDGTDHGWGNNLLALGGGVNGGQLFGQWPGLAPEELFQNADVWSTTDYRTVFAECLMKRFHNNQIWQIFPGFEEQDYQPLGVFSGSLIDPDFNDPEVIFRSGLE